MANLDPHALRHLQLCIEGLVQGVGFRPWLHRLAVQFDQNGQVANRSQGVIVELEGRIDQQQALIATLQSQLPPFAEIHSLRIEQRPWVGYCDFSIVTSHIGGKPSRLVLPDIAPCADCIADIRNPDSRFYRYPFTSCSHCGPRYSILRSQPYDRERTSMARFRPCSVCEREYGQPDNRRFHAQTIACPACGPVVSLCDAQGQTLAQAECALTQTVGRLHAGDIVAVKGVGGFQLLVDAANGHAVRRLRQRKQRAEKPFALLLADIATAQAVAQIDAAAEAVLTRPSAPIVLLPRQPHDGVADAVAPGQAFLGVMLPASPLHQLLADAFGGPLVATSGNRHHAPLCYRNDAALQTLADIADVFLWHDRDIVRPLDDSVVKFIAARATVLRRARGYAPLPLTVKQPLPPSIALGGHYKNTIALADGHSIIASPHIGDLDDNATLQAFDATVSDMQTFFGITPTHVMHDLHPDFHSTRAAAAMHGKKHAVQHHLAHVFSAMAEHGLEPPVTGFAWDGVGIGEGGEILGSECLSIQPDGYRCLARLYPLPLLGGDRAAREPRRSALSVLYGLLGDRWPDLPCVGQFQAQERALLASMLRNGVNCPPASSAGRLFDAVASLLDLCHVNSFEGQAAMLLEQAALRSVCKADYPYRISGDTPALIDWHLMLSALLDDIGNITVEDIAAKFHNTLAAVIVDIASRAHQANVVLSGGVFQNACLGEKTVTALERAGFSVYLQQHWPANDGGLAIGQIYHLSWSRS
ncbi:MAG: carbamoyltransferase HypF [Methylomonas sp.]|nr:carbamoyltransferase HypF [Methylomonas sp.]